MHEADMEFVIIRLDQNDKPIKIFTSGHGAEGGWTIISAALVSFLDSCEEEPNSDKFVSRLKQKVIFMCGQLCIRMLIILVLV